VGRDEITHDGALTMREIIERIPDAYAAFNQRDIDRALSVMHSDVREVEQPIRLRRRRRRHREEERRRDPR
jgi:hypothetical protein